MFASPFFICELTEVPMADQSMQRILAALQTIPAGNAAVVAASNQILAALGEKPSNLLRAKAALYIEMADMLDACEACNEGKADDGAFGEKDDKDAKDAKKDDGKDEKPPEKK
jgi:hypothetical protein